MTAPLNKQGWTIASVLGALADTRLSMVRGDTELLTLTCLLPDGTSPLDLTGATVTLTGKASLGDAVATLSKAGVLTADPTTGVVTFELDPVDTRQLAIGALHIDARASWAGVPAVVGPPAVPAVPAVVYTVLTGQLALTGTATPTP